MLSRRLFFFWLSALLLSSCSRSPQPPPSIGIGISPWPGYEHLYLASKKGYFADAGLNVRIVQYSSLADVQRAFMQNRIDGMATTLVEPIQTHHLVGNDAKIVLVTDYSNGADVIIGGKGINSISDLKGRKIGLEVSSLGIFMLSRALETNGLTLEDIKIHNVGLQSLEEALEQGVVDAVVTVTQEAGAILNRDDCQVIFDSSQIPREVVDVVTIRSEFLNQNPAFVASFRKVWDRALEYGQANPEESLNIMATRERISPADMTQTLETLRLLKSTEQMELFEPDGVLDQSIRTIERVLRSADAIPNNECDADHLYRGN